MNNHFIAPSLALAGLFAAAFPVQAQSGLEAFNPMTFLAPIMTPLGAVLVPMTAPMNTPANNAATPFNPAAMFNPALFNPAMLPSVPALPGYGAPAGMVPFTGLQAAPQAYGMAPQMVPQMANPFAGMPQFQQPSPSAFPAFPSFPGLPFPFPSGR